MSNVQVRNIPEDLHEALRLRAGEVGTSISEYVLHLIRQDLRRPNRRSWLDRVARLPSHQIPREMVTQALAEARDGDEGR